MPRRSLTIEQVLTTLAETPPRIADLTVDLTTTQLHAAPSPGEWSVNDVLAHLRACAEVWGDCIVTIINQDTPTLQGVNPRAWIKETDYPRLKFRPSFRAFTTQRTELLSDLEPLPPAGWSRTATVTGMLPGQVFERTVLYYAEKMARHERPHVRQIQRIVNTMRM